MSQQNTGGRNKAIVFIFIGLIVASGIGIYIAWPYINAQVPADDDSRVDPNTPDGLNAFSQVPLKVILTFAPVEGSMFYRVYRSTSTFSKNSADLFVGSTENELYIDTLSTSGDFFYGVTSIVDGVESKLSRVVSVFVPDETGATVVPSTPVMSPAQKTGDSIPHDVLLSFTSGGQTATSYTIYKKTSMFSDSNKGTASKTIVFSLSHTDHIVDLGTYYYGVTASNSIGESSLSNVISVVITQTVPTMYPAVQKSGTPPFNVLVSFSAITGSLAYNVYRSTSDFENKAQASLQTIISETSYTDALYSEGMFYYAVSSTVNGVESALSTRASVNVVADVVLVPPVLQTLTVTKQTSPYTIQIIFGAVSGASSYTIYRSVSQFSSTADAIPVKTTSATTDTDSVFSSGLFFYGITAIVSGKETPLSNVKNVLVENVQIPPSPPQPPVLQSPITTNVDEEQPGKYKATISFGMSAGATSYKIYRKLSSFTNDDKSTATVVGNPTAIFFYDWLTVSGTYYYGVTAVNANGESVLSNVASTTVSVVILSAPTVALVSGPTITGSNPVVTKSVTLSWALVPSTTYYEVYASYSTSFSTPLFQGTINQPSSGSVTWSRTITFAGAVQADFDLETIYYRVYACSSSPTVFKSSPSNMITATFYRYAA